MYAASYLCKEYSKDFASPTRCFQRSYVDQSFCAEFWEKVGPDPHDHFRVLLSWMLEVSIDKIDRKIVLKNPLLLIIIGFLKACLYQLH